MISASLSIPAFVNTSGGRVQIEKTVPGGSNVVLVDVMAGQTSSAYSGSLNAGESVKADPAGAAAFSIPFSGVITNEAVAAVTFTPVGGAGSVAGSADAVQVTASYSGAFTKRNDKLSFAVA